MNWAPFIWGMSVTAILTITGFVSIWYENRQRERARQLRDDGDPPTPPTGPNR